MTKFLLANEHSFVELDRGDGLTTALIDRDQYLCKYYCRSCKKLQLPARHTWPEKCGMCGSTDIDTEADLESQRLEHLRFGNGAGQEHILAAKRAEGLIKTLLSQRGEDDRRMSATPSKETLVELGSRYADLYRWAKTDDEVEDVIEEHVLELEALSPTKAMVFRESMRVPDQVILILGSACWHNSGLPVIRLGHKRAAALMATEITDQSVEYVKPPFKAFFIELPSDLLHIEDSNGEMRRATGVLVHARTFERRYQWGDKTKEPGTYWNYAILTDHPLIQWKLSRLVEEIAGLSDRGNDWVGVGMPINDYDARVDLLVGRLICSTCIMMSSPDNLKEKMESTKRNKTGKKPAKNCSVYKVFTERQPINVDARRYVSAYLKGERDSPDVRLMVRGHHKMQAHGPRLTLRKLKWIEPYPRGGMENDPIMSNLYEARDKHE